MPQNQGFRKNQKSKQRNAAPVDDENPIAKAFYGYSVELDSKHDRQERLVKLSRDITIESKRIIFLLHTIDGRKNNKAKILEEAQQRLNNVIEVNFKAMAKELIGQDPYQFRYAYSPGLQEFIEAYSFMEYFKYAEETGQMSDWNQMQERMQYESEIPVDKKEQTKEDDNLPLKEKETCNYGFFVDPTEYILGVSDVTGELMRRCINSLGSGETDVCLETCKVLQHFYSGYISLNVHRCRDLSRKIFTMRQSVLKAENVCYNVKVRGGEAAKWGAVFDNKPTEDVDEGFF